MDEQILSEEWEKYIDAGQELIARAITHNEELYKQCYLLMTRSMRMIRFAAICDLRPNEPVPAMIVEKEKALINEASNNLVNEVKILNNVKNL